MSELPSWYVTAASNNSSPPDGWPEGMTTGNVNNSAREMMASLKRAWNYANPTVTAAGTADAMTLTYSPALAAYTTNQTFAFYKNASDNTGAATLNINGLGAKAIVKRDGSTALGVADMKASALYVVTYDGTSFRLHFTGV